MRKVSKIGLNGAVLVVGLALGGILVFLNRGISAQAQPFALETAVARRLRHLAIPRGARELPNPVPASDEVRAEGLAHFADHCAVCHANDGSGTTQIGQDLYLPAPDMRLEDTQALSDGSCSSQIEGVGRQGRRADRRGAGVARRALEG